MRELLLFLLMTTLPVANAVAGKPMPPLAAQTLAGEPMQLPAALPDRTALLIVGFTRASRTQTSAWSRCLAWDASDPADVAIFQVAVIEDIPALFRNAAIHGMRKSVPAAMHPRFLLATEDAARWKALTGFVQPDAAYLVLLDTDREIVWRHDGDASAPACRGLQDAIDAAARR